jgi:hypothetical protein
MFKDFTYDGFGTALYTLPCPLRAQKYSQTTESADQELQTGRTGADHGSSQVPNGRLTAHCRYSQSALRLESVPRAYSDLQMFALLFGALALLYCTSGCILYSLEFYMRSEYVCQDTDSTLRLVLQGRGLAD